MGNHDYGDYVNWNTPEQKIKNLKWENLKQFSPVEKSFIMDLKEAVAKRKIIEFLAGKEDKE